MPCSIGPTAILLFLFDPYGEPKAAGVSQLKTKQ